MFAFLGSKQSKLPAKPDIVVQRNEPSTPVESVHQTCDSSLSLGTSKSLSETLESENNQKQESEQVSSKQSIRSFFGVSTTPRTPSSSTIESDGKVRGPSQTGSLKRKASKNKAANKKRKTASGNTPSK